MRNLLGFLAMLFIAGCKPASAPGVTEQTIAKGVVDTLADAWSMAANACVEVAASQEPAIGAVTLENCRNTLNPARQYLMVAAQAVDTWGEADKTTFSCLVISIVGDLQAAMKLPGMPATPVLMQDAFQIADVFMHGCNDAGMP